MSETRKQVFKIVLQITCQLLWVSSCNDLSPGIFSMLLKLYSENSKPSCDGAYGCAVQEPVDYLCNLNRLQLVGLVLGLSAVYLLLNYSHSSLFFSHTYIILPACFALASAVFLLVSGGLGLVVSLRASAGLQALFVYLLVIVLCLEATAAALAHVYIKKVPSELALFRDVLQRYTGSSQDTDSNAVDTTQEELQCCGIYDYQDWLATPWFNHSGHDRVPHSCCNSKYPMCNGTLDLTELLYPKGCQMKLEEALRFVLHIIIWSSLAVALIEAVGFVSVAQLTKEQNLPKYQILGREGH